MNNNSLSRWATWREIQRQPEIWRAWAGDLPLDDLRAWLAGLNPPDVWFCGAGSSAYVGEIVVAGLEGRPGAPRRAVATTDIVSRPAALLADRRGLVVNFGRSGDSAETIGTLRALDALAPGAARLNVTCNPGGALAADRKPGARVLLLPEATHDAGFAMTSSFTTMLLSALALFDSAAEAGWLADMATALEALLPRFATEAEAMEVPERIVFVGAGPMAFAAREAALKVMELSAGAVPALWDSTLGFRHGPKSFVTPGTTIVVFRSGEEPAALYDGDLVTELRAQFPTSRILDIGPGAQGLEIAWPHGEAWSAALAVAFAQVLAVVWADRSGRNVDDPFAGAGTLTRVVEGVKLYPVRSG